MKANELRIGNITKPDWNKKKYTTVTPLMIVEQFQSNYADSDYLKPIGLTKELIYNFGFKKDFIINGFKLGYFEIKIINGVFWYDIVELKYAHQLQNLYFAITGNELILKL